MRRLAIPLVISMTLPISATAQPLNWRALEGGDRHLVAASFGIDHGSWYGVSWRYYLPNAPIPMTIGSEARLPFGSDVFDDWEVGIGAQGEAWRRNALSLSVGTGLQFRRFESLMARVYHGSLNVDVSLGLSGRRWSVAGLAGYSGSGITHIKHVKIREYYPAVRDGWYEGAGGNIRFAAVTGFSTRSWGVVLTGGRIFGKDFRDNPTLPFFAEVTIRRSL